MKRLRMKLALIMLFPVGLALFYLVPENSPVIEKYYSNGFYKVLAQVISTITGIFPFSTAEFALLALVLLVPVFLIITAKKIIAEKGAKSRLMVLLAALLNVAAAFSVAYFVLVTMWTMNYNRLPFADIAGLKTEKATVSDLAEVCEYLAQQANMLREQVTEDENGLMTVEGGYTSVFSRAVKGYEAASSDFPELKGSYGRPKPVILSRLMSYTGIEGVYCPFTAEANVNINIPLSSLPATTCHEMAHQRGFAREDEANFIAYLTCSLHPDPDFQYSGTLLALIHSMNALYRHNRSEYGRIVKQYSPGVLRDLRNEILYWEQYEGPVEEISNKVNDAYLKANKQQEGVHSYGRMVDLLIASYKKEKGE